MSEKIEKIFQQAESVKPITEVSKQYTPEELAEIEKERSETERGLFEEGADYKTGTGTGDRKLIATQEQIQKIHEDEEKFSAQKLHNKLTEEPPVKKEGIKISDIQNVKTTKKGIKIIENPMKEEEVAVSHSWKGFKIIPKIIPKSDSEIETLRRKKPPEDKYDEKKIVEKFLWGSAEASQQERIDLEKRISILETEIANMWSGRLNLHEQDILANKEKEYQQLTSQLGQKKQIENEAWHKLTEWELGIMNPEVKNELLQTIEGNEPLSKRKQRIEEERERIKKNLNIIDDEYATQIAHKGGQQGTHLTTGRHGTSITGNFSPEEAPEKFYDATTDTHGGKVSYGKRPRKSAGGKTIRKS